MVISPLVTNGLPLQFQAELQGLRSTHGIKLIRYSNRSDASYKPPKGRVRETRIRKIQVWMVQDIERFHAEDQMQPLGVPEILP
jgi:hypothetical protein